MREGGRGGVKEQGLGQRSLGKENMSNREGGTDIVKHYGGYPHKHTFKTKHLQHM